MSRKSVVFLMSAVLAAGALALAAAPAEAGRGGGGGGGGRGGGGGGRGGYGGGRGGYGGYGGYGRGYGGYGRGYGGYGYGFGVGLGYGLAAGYAPYYGYGGYAAGYVPYYAGMRSAYFPPSTDVVPVDPVPAVPNDAQPQPATDNKAHLMLIVPEDAEVWFQGQKTTRTGAEREFVSPELAPGKTFTYTVRVRYTKDGKVVDDTRSISVKANDKWSVDFTRPEPKTAK